MYVMCALTTICIYIFWFVCVCTQHMYMFAVAALRANSRFFRPYLVAPTRTSTGLPTVFKKTNCFQKDAHEHMNSKHAHQYKTTSVFSNFFF